MFVGTVALRSAWIALVASFACVFQGCSFDFENFSFCTPEECETDCIDDHCRNTGDPGCFRFDHYGYEAVGFTRTKLLVQECVNKKCKAFKGCFAVLPNHPKLGDEGTPPDGKCSKDEKVECVVDWCSEQKDDGGDDDGDDKKKKGDDEESFLEVTAKSRTVLKKKRGKPAKDDDEEDDEKGKEEDDDKDAEGEGEEDQTCQCKPGMGECEKNRSYIQKKMGWGKKKKKDGDEEEPAGGCITAEERSRWKRMISSKCEKIKDQEKCEKRKDCEWDAEGGGDGGGEKEGLLELSGIHGRLYESVMSATPLVAPAEALARRITSA